MCKGFQVLAIPYFIVIAVQLKYPEHLHNRSSLPQSFPLLPPRRHTFQSQLHQKFFFGLIERVTSLSNLMSVCRLVSWLVRFRSAILSLKVREVILPCTYRSPWSLNWPCTGRCMFPDPFLSIIVFNPLEYSPVPCTEILWLLLYKSPARCTDMLWFLFLVLKYCYYKLSPVSWNIEVVILAL